MKINYSLYLVTTRKFLKSKSLPQLIAQAIQGGVTIVQLREKDLSYSEFKNIALQILKITQQFNVPLIINDNIKLAKEINAAGAHIGQSDVDFGFARDYLKNQILGISVSSYEEAVEALKYHPDYLGVGAVFLTSTKNDVNYVSPSDLTKIVNEIKIPIVAIGGINKTNIPGLKTIGINNFAICSEILNNEDEVFKNTKLLKETI